MNLLRTALVYTLLLFVVGVAAGMVLSISGRVLGLEHRWGAFDVTMAIRVVLTLAAALSVFAVLARRRPDEYYLTGALIVPFTAILSTASAYLGAPQDARGAYSWIALTVWPLAFNAIALVVAGLIFRRRELSSNKLLDRTREG